MRHTANTFSIQSFDHHQIPAYSWKPESEIRGVIHISHGMAEYGSRYERLAEQLIAQGFIVYSHDHRGHGAAIHQDSAGFFSHSDGWNSVVKDLTAVVCYIKTHHPELPCFLLGHSMGSYILQSYLIENKPKVDGVILSGSNFAPAALLYIAKALSHIEIIRQGEKGKSSLINQLTFAGYNKSFKPNRTEFDWLSRNPDEVDLYINDPLCGFQCTNRLWADLFQGLLHISSLKNLEKIQQDLPFFIMGGEKDPVSAPSGQQNLKKALDKAGMKDVTLALYPEGRHEMFNETNHEQVISRLIQWLDSHFQSTTPASSDSLLETA